MTDEVQAGGCIQQPFLLLFAERLPSVAPNVLRYDVARQQSEVLVDGRWVDAINAPVPDSGTRVTKVGFETSDDK